MYFYLPLYTIIICITYICIVAVTHIRLLAEIHEIFSYKSTPGILMEGNSWSSISSIVITARFVFHFSELVFFSVHFVNHIVSVQMGCNRNSTLLQKLEYYFDKE